MESQVLVAYNSYKEKLAEFVVTLKRCVKAESSINEVCAGLGITRNMYYQRLNYPQNMPYEEVSELAKIVNDDTLIQLHQQAQQLGHDMATVLTNCLNEADITVTFLCRKLGIDTSNFYRKQKDPRLWKQQEIEKIVHVVETVNSL